MSVTCYRCFIMRREMVVAMLCGMQAGEPEACRVYDIITEFEAGLAQRGKAPFCLCCDHAFRPGGEPPSALLIVELLGGGPAEIPKRLVAGICETCAERHDDSALYQRMRESFDLAWHLVETDKMGRA